MISTEEFCNIVKTYDISINNVVEIGSLHGIDAYKMEHFFTANKVYVFEAHPKHADNIQKKYPHFIVVNKAVSNKKSIVEFNSVVSDEGNLGMSSMREKSIVMEELNVMNGCKNNEQYEKIQVEGIRMEDWIHENNIENIDICKIDVEGCSFECLEGFGSKINIVKFIHIENEHIECWKDQKLFHDVKNVLEQNNFQLLQVNICGPEWAKEQQSDSVWVNKQFLQKKI